MENMKKALTGINKLMSALQAALLVLLTAAGIVLTARGNIAFGVIMLAADVLVFCAFAVAELYVEKETQIFVCEKCGARFKADWKNVLNGAHRKGRHLMHCPECGEKGWHKAESIT